MVTTSFSTMRLAIFCISERIEREKASFFQSAARKTLGALWVENIGTFQKATGVGSGATHRLSPWQPTKLYQTVTLITETEKDFCGSRSAATSLKLVAPSNQSSKLSTKKRVKSLNCLWHKQTKLFSAALPPIRCFSVAEDSDQKSLIVFNIISRCSRRSVDVANELQAR